MAIKLTERLLAAATLIRGGGIVADIGTDHGYLPIYLIQSGIITEAVAADIGKMPLENAARSVKSYGLEKEISLRLSDGLNAFSPDEADEFVFAGMGGTLIAEKLSEAEWIKDERYHFVFQPQSRAEDLREYLFSNGFEINKEIATHEGRRVYIAFDASYTGALKPFSKGDCFIGRLPKTEDAFLHIAAQLKRLEKKYDAIKKTGSDAEELRGIIEIMRNFIND